MSGSFSLELAPGDYEIYCPGATTERSPFTVTAASPAPSGAGTSPSTDAALAAAPDAHVRLAMPSTAAGERILRRGYSYTDGIHPQTGLLDAGLFFIAYQKDPRTGFVPIQRRLAGLDSLNEYIRHTGSAVFACPPGLGCGRLVGADAPRLVAPDVRPKVRASVPGASALVYAVLPADWRCERLRGEGDEPRRPVHHADQGALGVARWAMGAHSSGSSSRSRWRPSRSC